MAEKKSTNIVRITAAQKKPDTRKSSEKKFGKPVLALGFCIVPSLMMKAQARLGLNPAQFNIIMQLADIWWDPERKPFPKKELLAERMGMSEDEKHPEYCLPPPPLRLPSPKDAATPSPVAPNAGFDDLDDDIPF